MTMATGTYGVTIEDTYDATALDPNLDGDTMNNVLVTDTYTPNFNTHTASSDVTNEISGTGYTTGGATLTGQTWATSGGYVTADYNDPSWTTATFTARGAVLNDSTLSKLIAAVTFGADYSVTSGTFTQQLSANGWFRFQIT